MISGSLDISALTQAVQGVAAADADWRDPFADMGADVRQGYAQTFARGGPGWPKPAAGNRPGVKTGALRASFVDEGSPGNVSEVGEREASFGSELPYAEEFQQSRPVAKEPNAATLRQFGQKAGAHIASAFDGLQVAP